MPPLFFYFLILAVFLQCPFPASPRTGFCHEADVYDVLNCAAGGTGVVTIGFPVAQIFVHLQRVIPRGPIIILLEVDKHIKTWTDNPAPPGNGARRESESYHTTGLISPI